MPTKSLTITFNNTRAISGVSQTTLVIDLCAMIHMGGNNYNSESRSFKDTTTQAAGTVLAYDGGWANNINYTLSGEWTTGGALDAIKTLLLTEPYKTDLDIASIDVNV